MTNPTSMPPGWELVVAKVDRFSKQMDELYTLFNNRPAEPSPDDAGARILRFPPEGSPYAAARDQYAEQPGPADQQTPNPFQGLMPQSIGAFGLAGMNNGLLPAGSPGLSTRPVIFRDLHRTVLHDQDGTESIISATEEVRVVDPRTGAQTFFATEHQFMSTDGQLITPMTALYSCQFCKRRLLTHMNHCTHCHAPVCPECVAISTSSEGTEYSCPHHRPRRSSGFADWIINMLYPF